MCDSGIAERRRPRGAALIIAMLIMAVLLLAGTTFMTISSTESQIAHNETSLVRAFHAAETVLNKTIVTLNGNSGYPGGSGTLASDVSYTVGVTTPADQPCPTGDARTIAARGSVNVQGVLVSVDLSATVDRITYPFRFAAFSTVPNLIETGTRSESELWFGASAQTDSFDSSLGAYNLSLAPNNPPNTLCPGGVACGNKSMFGSAGANGDTYFSSSNNIYGDLRVGDAINNESYGMVSGLKARTLSDAATSPGEPYRSITPPTTPTTSLALASGTVTLGAAGVNSYYYYTTVSFWGSTTLQVNGPVTIYVSGAVATGLNVTWGNAANPTWLKVVLKSTGTAYDSVNFTTGSGFRLYGGLYGKNTNIDIGTDSTVYGSVIGRLVYLRDRTVVHYNQALGMQPVCDTGNYQVRRGTWREVLPSW